MKATSSQRIVFVPLDRPNPFKRIDVAETMLGAGRESIVEFLSQPIGNGATASVLTTMSFQCFPIACEIVAAWRRDLHRAA